METPAFNTMLYNGKWIRLDGKYYDRNNINANRVFRSNWNFLENITFIERIAFVFERSSTFSSSGQFLGNSVIFITTLEQL